MDDTFASGQNLRTLFEFARNLLLLSDLTFLVQNGYTLIITDTGFKNRSFPNLQSKIRVLRGSIKYIKSGTRSLSML